MVFVLSALWMIALSAFCSDLAEGCGLAEPSPRSFVVPHLPVEGIEPDVAIVQFFDEGVLYQVRWDTFCAMYNMCASAQMVLERTLLNGDRRGRFVSAETEISVLLTGDERSLKSCLRQHKRVSYDGLEGQRLREKHVAAMFPDGQAKLWQILPLGYDCALVDKEVRVWFSAGGLRCLPTNKKEVSFLVTPGSERLAQIQEEDSESFVADLKKCARKELRALQEASKKDGGLIVVRYVNRKGLERCSAFRGDSIYGTKAQTLNVFLHDCVLQGTFKSYLDNVKKHYAFVNESLCDVVTSEFVFCVEFNHMVEDVPGKRSLDSEDLRACPRMAWMVVPQGSLQRPRERCTISLTFAGVSLEGHPLVDVNCGLSGLTPRNYLWALSYDDCARLRLVGESWYPLLVRPRRLIWDVYKYMF